MYMATYLYIAFCFIPFAIHYNSKLLGFLTILTLYFASDFTVFCTGLVWCIGFNTMDSLYENIIRSLIVIIVSLTMCMMGFSTRRWFAPFAIGINVLGPLNYFLGLLIACNRP
eukprot:UN20931